MKIIDYEKKGNVIRFYYGKNDCNDYWGDDWDDPLDNAGTVYKKYVVGYTDVAFPYDWFVADIKDNYYNCCSFTKQDLKNRKTPCIIVVPYDVWHVDDSYYGPGSYSEWSGSDNKEVYKFYFEDDTDRLYTLNKSRGDKSRMFIFPRREDE